MNPKKKIMIIGAGVLQVPAIIKAKEMNLNIIALDMDQKAPGFKYADTCLQISTIDINKAIAEARKLKPDAVMTLASDMPIRTVAAIGEELSLVTISKETALNATDKGIMREKLKKYNVAIPEFYIVSSCEEFIEIASNLKGSFIVKPVDNSGSRGVFLVNSKQNLKEVYEYSIKYSRTGKVLIEEYMIGPEVSVETMTLDGETHVIAITDKLTTGAPYFIEMGHSIPSQLPIDIQKEIIDITISAIEAIGINVGPSHTEIIITKDGPKIVELGARLGGDNITTHLVPLATGINMVECSIRLALGESIRIPQKLHKGSVIRYLKSPLGVLKSIDYLEEAKKIDGIKDIVLIKSIGDKIKKLESSNDRIGYVIAQGNSAKEAIEICEKAVDVININAF